MHFHFELAQDHLRAELFGRQAAEETQQFVAALLAEIGRTAARRVLIWVRNSRPIFREVRASHQYLEVLAAQQGSRLRAIPPEIP